MQVELWVIPNGQGEELVFDVPPDIADDPEKVDAWCREVLQDMIANNVDAGFRIR